MWCHYADRHQGVVLEFRCADELDSAWLAAKPVSYPQVKPAVYTADGWAELISLRRELSIQAMLDLATYTKSSDWAYEREWRIATFKRPTESGNFTDYGFSKHELGAIYLGPMVDPEERRKLIAAAATYPAARLVDTQIGPSREFLFSPVPR